MNKHPHAELIMQFAQDAMETDKPWERWEWLYERDGQQQWIECPNNVIFSESHKYRRKPQKKPVDLSVLVDSGIDIEVSVNDKWRIGKLESIVECCYLIQGSSRGWTKCRPRMNHVHAWQGGECPLPGGLKIKVYTCYSGKVKESETTTGDGLKAARWGGWQVGAGDPTVGFEILGLMDGYCWPWELDNDHP